MGDFVEIVGNKQAITVVAEATLYSHLLLLCHLAVPRSNYTACPQHLFSRQTTCGRYGARIPKVTPECASASRSPLKMAASARIRLK